MYRLLVLEIRQARYTENPPVREHLDIMDKT